MTFPVELVCVLLGCVAAIQAWVLKEVIALKVESTRLHDRVARLESVMLNFSSDTEQFIKKAFANK